jgi:hypothetical protein
MNMVKITYEPANELVLHDLMSVDKDDILRSRVTPAGTMPLFWCDGILFTFSSPPFTDDVVKDYLKGKIHWIEMQYTKMDSYVPVLQLSEEEYKTQMNVRIIDTTKSKLHRELIKWLKSNVKEGI